MVIAELTQRMTPKKIIIIFYQCDNIEFLKNFHILSVEILFKKEISTLKKIGTLTPYF